MGHVCEELTFRGICPACLLHCRLCKLQSLFKLFTSLLLFTVKPRSVRHKNDIEAGINGIKVELLVEYLAVNFAHYVDFIQRVLLRPERYRVRRKRMCHLVNLLVRPVKNWHYLIMNICVESVMHILGKYAPFSKVIADCYVIASDCHVSNHLELPG